MKRAALRTLSLALVLTVVIGVCLRYRVVTAAAAGTAVTAGEFLVDPPTLINLGFEWFIQGDDNRNASVDVSYRKQGTTDWKQALPMLRLQGERIKQGDQLDVVSPNMFAGSILDLEPNTAYETRFVLRDPDGVSGQATKTVTVRTRPEPMPATGGNVYHVYPPGYKGAKIEPSFEGLMCAYNLTCAGTDWATAGRPRVKAGDTILVHAGLYKYNRYEYTNDPAVNRHDTARRDLLPAREGHRRQAHRRSKAQATVRRFSTAPATSRCSTSVPRTTPTSKA